MTDLRGCVLVRTWFGDDARWATLREEVSTPSDEGFLADVVPVDDRQYAGLTPAALAELDGIGPNVSFLADEVTFATPDHPVLAVRVRRSPGAGERDAAEPFRVVPGELWSVENNINLSNMDWSDFTNRVDEDGVFRGF